MRHARPRPKLLDNETISRIAKDLGGAIRRKPQHEARLAGIARAVIPSSDLVREAAEPALGTLIERESVDRPLYAALLRGLAQAEGSAIVDHVAHALTLPDAGGYAALSAACFVEDEAIASPLAHVAAMRHPHLSFAAEVARLARHESNGEHLTSIAPRIKESHRIDLCTEIFVPLLNAPPLPKQIGPCLDILQVTERHLGRWLVFGEISVRAGNEKPLREAKKRAESGTTSTKNAWTLISWALQYDAPPTSTRPNSEIVARLSDKPSAKRDMTFLFRMADAGSPSTRGMLEGLVKSVPLSTEVAIRAASYLVRDHDRDDLVEALHDTAKSGKPEELRGLAAAALWDAEQHQLALELANKLASSRSLVTATWATLVQSAAEYGWNTSIVTEENFRHIQMGCVI